VSPAAVAIASLCFFFSGLGSLVLEVVWTRELRLVFGSTTLAASTILVAYMLGLGLGALGGGRLARGARAGVRAYGVVEIGIGLYAVCVPLVFARFGALNRAVLYQLPFWPAALCRFFLALGVLLVPTLLMGATLPVLVGAIARDEASSGRRVALLYAINTAGAMTGVFLATFVFFPAMGLWWTNATGGLVDAAVGVVALTALRRLSPASRRAESPVPALRVREPTPLLPAYAVVGFTSLVFEVSWTRALSMVFGSSVYAFACMLAAFLFGIALGSFAARTIVDRIRRPLDVCIAAIALLGLLSLATTLALPRLPDVFVRGVRALGTSGRGLVGVQFGLGVLVMMPPTVVLGALFPLLARGVAASGRDVAASVGDVYFANTLGSAAGAFAAGFVLVPALGLRGTLALASALDLAGAAFLAAVARRAPLAAALAVAAAALAILPLPWNAEELTRGVFREPLRKVDVGVRQIPLDGVPYDELVFYRDGLSATVSVHRDGNLTFLKLNGKTDASVPGDVATQVLQGHVPVLFGRPAERVLVVGFASGMTVGSALREPVRRVDAVEIEPSVLEASHFFDEYNGRPLDDPRVRVVIDDGRTYLSGTHERYDVVVSEPSNPWISGVSNLFTREFFQAARSVLRPGGRLLQWVQLYGLDAVGLRSILAAVHGEFPFVYVFSFQPGYGDVLVLAALEPLRPGDVPRWETLSEPVKNDLQRVGIFNDADLWSLLRVGPADVDRLVAGAPVVNTDENLHVELASPWLLQNENDTVNANWALLRPFTDGAVPTLEAAGERLDPARLGALAFSYADGRGDRDVGSALVRSAERAGGSAQATAAAAVLEVKRRGAGDPVLAQLDAAVARDPDAFEARLARARVRRDLGRTADALDDADAASAVAPDDPRPRALRWTLLHALGRDRDAEAILDTMAASPYLAADTSFWRPAAEVYFARGRLDDGIRYLRGALQANRTWVDGWVALARAYGRAGRAEESTRAARNAERARQNQAILAQREARLAAWRGDPKRAVAILEDARLRYPTYAPLAADLERLRGEQAKR
jgi:spermidine synthase